jgi:hypothetical protein
MSTSEPVDVEMTKLLEHALKSRRLKTEIVEVFELGQVISQHIELSWYPVWCQVDLKGAAQPEDFEADQLEMLSFRPATIQEIEDVKSVSFRNHSRTSK